MEPVDAATNTAILSARSIPLSRVATDKIVLFGDSLTELSSDLSLGFALAPALQHEYFRKLQVITRGYGGYNSEHARHLIEPILDFEAAGGLCRIRLLTIFFGTNDTSTNDYQHIPVERYRENLQFLVQTAAERQIPTIVTGPGPIDEYSAAVEENGFSTVRSQTYAAAARAVAAEAGVPFIDLWTALQEAKGWQPGDPVLGQKPNQAAGNHLRDLLTDGVHFTGKAYRIWFDLLNKFIVVRSTVKPHEKSREEGSKG